MACCKCCCGQRDCVEGDQGKCCCGGVNGECCEANEYCCNGQCRTDPCPPPECGRYLCEYYRLNNAFDGDPSCGGQGTGTPSDAWFVTPWLRRTCLGTLACEDNGCSCPDNATLNAADYGSGIQGDPSKFTFSTPCNPLP